MKRTIIWTSLFVLFIITLNILLENSKLKNWAEEIDVELKEINVPLYDSLKILRAENKELYLSSDTLWAYVENCDSLKTQETRVEKLKIQYQKVIPAVVGLFLLNLIICVTRPKKKGPVPFRHLLKTEPFLFCKISVILCITGFFHFIWHFHTANLYAINLTITLAFFVLKSFFALRTYNTTPDISTKQNAQLVLIFDAIICGILLCGLALPDIAHA